MNDGSNYLFRHDYEKRNFEKTIRFEFWKNVCTNTVWAKKFDILILKISIKCQFILKNQSYFFNFVHIYNTKMIK